jgi:hypothetical protein
VGAYITSNGLYFNTHLTFLPVAVRKIIVIIIVVVVVGLG